MKRYGEIEPPSVLAMLASARCAFTESAPPSLACTPRTDEPLKVLTSLDEARAAVDTAAATALRMISIYTPDLEPELYDQSTFLEIIKRFVLSRSFSKVRVLLADPARLARDDNRFVAMGRRLSSYIDIRHIGGRLPERAASGHERAAAVPGGAAAFQRCSTAVQGCPAAVQGCAAFLIADDRAIVHRLRADAWDGIADFDNPAVARLYLGEFDALWSRSAPEDALRPARRG